MNPDTMSWSLTRLASCWKWFPWGGLTCRTTIALIIALGVTFSIAWFQALAWKLLPQTLERQSARAIIRHDASGHHASPCCPEHRSILELSVFQFTNVIADIRAFELLCRPRILGGRYRLANSITRTSLPMQHIGHADRDDAGSRRAFVPRGYTSSHRLVERFVISEHYSMPVLEVKPQSILLKPDSSANQAAVGWPMRAFWGGVEYETDTPYKSLSQSTGRRGWTFRIRGGVTISSPDAATAQHNPFQRPSIVATRGLWVLNINRSDPDYDDPILSARAIPNIPIWPGLIANMVFWFAVFYLLTSLRFTVRAVWRIGKGRCRHCGYPIPETTSEAKCSECGKAVPAM